MKVLKAVKNIFFKIFGKAWWFLTAFGILFSFYFFLLSQPGLSPIFMGIRKDDDTSSFYRDIELQFAESFSVNNNGTAVITAMETSDGVAAVMDIETFEKSFSNINRVTVDVFDDYFAANNLVITDDDDIYAVRSYYDDNNSILLSDSIVRLTGDFKYVGTVSEINYDASGRQRVSKISKLHYFDGYVTYAVIEDDGVRLYSIDTDSQALTESDFYPTDEDGTFTINVIPIDGSFLFLRSDGYVYRVAFNEPLTESIYKFDVEPDNLSDNPYFDLAAVVDGNLYVADSWNSYTVSLLENGELIPVFDIDVDYSYITSMESYKYEEDDSASLVLCLNNGIYSYYDGETFFDSPVIKFDPTLPMYLVACVEVLLIICIIALVINLIIRKKTLLYKQLIIILPILAVITVFISVKVFLYSDEKNQQRINKDITVICDLGKDEFDDFDFTELMSANENTGNAYKALRDKLNKLGSEHGHDWSNEYIFSVVYRTDEDYMVILAEDDEITMPLHEYEVSEFGDLVGIEGGEYIDNGMMSFVEDTYAISDISVYGPIKDKNDTGRYFFKVGSDNSTLYEQRNEILANVMVYSFLVICALTLIIVLSSLNTIRVIKKASKAVKQISKGDLSARVNYKSKDELGQICSEVNEMGQNLEKMFDEKDETEKFYYKFVPEKFRELLGKEKFTDLSLGDAKSCELTVLFTDIRGFSINSEMMTAKENFAFANIIYGKMGPIVRNNNGFVDKYIGDAVMGLFENADDAVRCGIELYKSIVLDPSTAAELNVSDINIGIGVHTGMAMVGIVGEEERLSGTVISETVNMSSRLESLTKQYKTAMLVSKSTIDRMSDPDSLDLRYLGIVQVAGVNEVEALYEVLDCLSDDMRVQRSSNSRELREAIRLFSMGRRDEAAAALQELADSGRSDYVTDLYLNYIRGMSEDDKGNVFRFVRK